MSVLVCRQGIAQLSGKYNDPGVNAHESEIIPQGPEAKPRGWEAIVGSMMDDTDEEASNWEAMYDILCDLEENPVDINSADREDLERIPFLSQDEVADILEYIYRNGEMKSLGELAMITSMTYQNRMLLPYFITLGSKDRKHYPHIRNILKHGESTMMATANLPLYDRKGDKNGYLGYKYRHNLRYEYRYGDYLRVGMVGAQDAGEPFFSGGNGWGYDFYSYYLSIRKLGRLKSLTLGKYKLRLGLGLLVNNDFSMGKTTGITVADRSGANIRPHSSRSSYNYMQGAAATVSLGSRLDLTTFVSYKDFDATLNKDDGSIATILKSGYHRTEAEMKKKNNSTQFAAGASLSYHRSGFNFGTSAYYSFLNRELRPDTKQTYRRYYPSGNRFYGISIDYGYRNGRFTFSGETATGDSRAWATINTLACRLTTTLTARAIQRYYSYRYSSLFSQSFSEGGSVQNESGIYLGIDWQPSRKLSLSYYADAVYFPWAKYQAATSSRSFDNMLMMRYTIGNLTLATRYRYKMREKDNADKTGLIWQTGHRARFSALYNRQSWNVKAQYDLAFTSYKQRSFGYMTQLSGGLTPISKLSVYANVGYFHTQGYDSRIYSYERGMLYDFSFPSYYGKGIRYALILRYLPTKKLSVLIKGGTTNRFDTGQVGAALQQVDHSSLTDVQMQLRWKF